MGELIESFRKRLKQYKIVFDKKIDSSLQRLPMCLKCISRCLNQAPIHIIHKKYPKQHTIYATHGAHIRTRTLAHENKAV